MEDDKEKYLQQQGEILTDLLVRVAGMERILLKNNIITDKELEEKFNEVREEIMNMIQEKLQEQKLEI